MLGNKEPLRISDIQAMGSGVFGDLSLVVLSACETALGGPETYREGTIPDGREISGIAQTFIDAGADTVVASLWQVNDPATSTLMQQFYGNLAQGNEAEPVAIAQALQRAQLSLLNGNAASSNDRTRGNTGTVIPVPSPEMRSRLEARAYTHPYYWSAFIIIGNGF